MRICVCGAQAPFMRGGAELHMENLVAALSSAGHRVELVRLPVAWDREHLFDAPLAWRLLPVEGDLVIATNFPSYYVRHPRKVVWLFHQHRAAYDAADMPWSDFTDDEDSLETQRLLSDWDTRALEEAVRLFSTSRTVADRLARFNGLRATPLYHPPPLYTRLRSGSFGDYVLCATRLEANKRPELMVEALSYSKSAARLVIAGEGSLAGEIAGRSKRLGLGKRVELLGFLDDDELVRRYSEALAVMYAPYEEDYGYVTLQAFYSGKPVITTSDSGGVLEWVEDNVNGIVTDPTPSAIGTAIDRLASDPALAKRMGAAGRQKVAALNWDTVVNHLTSV